MLKLYQFNLVNGVNVSPFCYKVEIYLQLAKLPYEIIPTLSHKAPRGKLPYLVDGNKTIPDSSEIIDYLKKTYGDTLDQDLLVSEHAQGHLLRRVCEESLYFVLVYSRWLDPDFWPDTKKAFFSDLPPVIKNIIPGLVQSGIKKSLRGQGYGRHTPEQIYHIGAQDLQAIASTLQPKTFAVADNPTSYDATLYAFLSSILYDSKNTPLKRAAQKFPVLSAYLMHMKKHLESLK